jgi:hypothetical protein
MNSQAAPGPKAGRHQPSGRPRTYHQLIASAVDGLDNNSGETRRALYERARNALVAQLHSDQPVLVLADITKERLALEEAIRKVEAEAARNLRTELRTGAQELRSAAPVGGTPNGGTQVPSAPPWRDRSNPPWADLPGAEWSSVLFSARDRLLSARSSGQADAEAAKATHQTRDASSRKNGYDTRQQCGHQVHGPEAKLKAFPRRHVLTASDAEEQNGRTVPQLSYGGPPSICPGRYLTCLSSPA